MNLFHEINKIRFPNRIDEGSYVMVNQVAQSGISIILMGCAGYAFGHFAKMDPKLTATVWLVAEVSKHVFDYIMQGHDPKYCYEYRGFMGIAITTVLRNSLRNREYTFYQACLCILTFNFTLWALDNLSLAGKIVKPLKPVSPPTQHPANVNP